VREIAIWESKEMVQVSEVGSWVAGMAGTTASPTVFVEVPQILQRWVALLRAPSSDLGLEWGPGLKAATAGRVQLGRKMQMIMTTELKKWSGIEIGLCRNKTLHLLYQEHGLDVVLAFRFQFDWPGGCFLTWSLLSC
jgi:hypothetical protein